MLGLAKDGKDHAYKTYEGNGRGNYNTSGTENVGIVGLIGRAGTHHKYKTYDYEYQRAFR